MREMKDSGIPWIGRIPIKWNSIRCKYISSFQNGYAFDSKNLSSNFVYPVIRIGDIKEGTIDNINCQGVINNVGLEQYIVKDNDILLAMSGATVGKVGIAIRLKNTYINQRVGIIRTKFPKFLYYCLTTAQFIEYILLHANGSAQPNVSGGVYGNFYIPFPSLPEQKYIVNFLDKKYSEIDSIRKNVEAEIEALKQYKRSVITETVTKGLDKNVELKDSGIPWIGKIPKRWEIIKGKYILTYLQRPILSTDKVITCFRDGEVTLRSNRREEGFTISEKEIGYQGINAGDLVVHGMDGFAGSIGISDSRGKASPVLNVLNSSQDKKFLMYYLRSMAYNNVFLALSTGIRVRSCDLNWNKLANLPYAIPPIQVQHCIANYLDAMCSQIDSVIQKKQELLANLDTYKKSLIYEYVTGKKEVPAV